jgi:arabinose-5-phosphate isomerase
MLQEVVRKEGESLALLKDGISAEVAQVVSSLRECSGRVVVSGVGKAGLVGRKISATLASTGTPSFWLDPVNALHGDLGMVHSEDTAILISNSGSSGEIILTAEAMGNLGIRRLAMTRDGNTPLAQMCEDVLPLGCHREAGPFNLAPTCSTTAMLALGDAIALTLQQLRGFTQSDYGMFHPAGALGRRLKKVAQCMRPKDKMAVVERAVPIAEAVQRITASRCGLCVVVDEAGRLLGVFTDGDFRRCWEHKIDFDTPVGEQMVVPCKSVQDDALVEDAIEIMRGFKINALPVVNPDNIVVGMIDIQDVA